MTNGSGCPYSDLADRDEKETRFLIEQYHVISNNRLQHNDLFWNFQLIFITAQAFLLIVALGGLVNFPLPRAIGAFCGFVFGFLSYQSFERNRIMEVADAEFLLNIEKYFGSHNFTGLKVHHKPETYRYLSGKQILKDLDSNGRLNFFSRGSSYELWKCGMRLIMLIELILFCYHMFVYAFKNSQDAILWYKSYDCMRESFSKIAIGILVAIFAINWIVYMFHLVWKSNPNNVNSEAASKVKKCRIIVLILQTVFISAAILYSYYLYSNHIHSNQNYWIFLLIVCTILAAFPLFTYLQKPKST